MAFDAVIFDFDGLIIDSETSIFEIWSEIFRDHGGVLTMDQWRHALGTHNGFDPYAELASQTGRTLARDEWVPRISAEHWRRCETEPLRPGVLERMQEARTLELPAAVASSSGRQWVRPWLERHGLAEALQTICTRDDVAKVKPAPDLFLLAAERMGVSPARCLVFEDTPNGLAAAHAAGMWAVAVPSPLTKSLTFPHPHMVLESLAERTLAELRDLLRATEPTQPTQPT